MRAETFACSVARVSLITVAELPSGRSTGCAQLPVEHGQEDSLPALLLADDRFSRVEPLLEANPRLRLTPPQNAAAVSDLQQPQLDIAFHKRLRFHQLNSQRLPQSTSDTFDSRKPHVFRMVLQP